MQLNPRDQQRVAKAVKNTERRNPPALGGQFDPRRGQLSLRRPIYITSNTATGDYQGVTMSGTVTNLHGTTLTPTSTVVLLWNYIEAGSTATSPYLANDTFVMADFMGTDATTNYPIYWCEALYGTPWNCQTGD